mmetsp:Transcript_59542/g.145905  ORF Transcript_59542/g.145905 Transcript_59542/m.145905 type:complete len:115 (+) Transcript_59542:4187-4531(+)
MVNEKEIAIVPRSMDDVATVTGIVTETMRCVNPVRHPQMSEAPTTNSPLGLLLVWLEAVKVATAEVEIGWMIETEDTHQGKETLMNATAVAEDGTTAKTTALVLEMVESTTMTA